MIQKAKGILKGFTGKCLPPTQGNGRFKRRMRAIRGACIRIRPPSHPLSRSQYGQDAFVLKWIGSRQGVFVDIGAHDGISYSNSHLLEGMGWTGVCVEPNPDVFTTLSRNRKCKCVNAAIAAAAGRMRFTQATGYGEMLSGASGVVNDTRIREAIAMHGGEVREIQVDAVTFSHLLLDMDSREIDYLSIDTEGLEFEILKTIDLTAIRVKIISIENNRDDDEVELYLRDRGYRLAAILGSDLMFAKKY
jgi:FkbM family methyltransferase